MLSLDATVHILWLGTPIAACLSGVTVLTALSVDTWLKSEEKILNPSYRNGSSKVEYLSKWTTSGLFTLCATDVGRKEFHCQRIDYFPTEEYSPDPNDSTMAIPHTVLKSVGFFLTAVVLLTAAEFLCLSGHCCNRRRFFTFFSGITFIISGLFMMLGMVIYIATLKGEVAEKLRPRSTFQPPLFAYTYGSSCYLIMLGFITTEIAGISAIFLYIYWHKRDWSKKEEQKYNSQLLETPPPCLKHPRPRSLSFHSSIEQESIETPNVRRTRSQQFLDQRPRDQAPVTHHFNHVGHNHISHQNHNHTNQYSHLQNNQQQQHQPPYQKPPPPVGYKHYHKDTHRSSVCDLESLHQPQHQNPRQMQHPTHHQHQQHHSQHHQHQHQPTQQKYQYHQQHSYPTSSSHQSVHWTSRPFEGPPKTGRSLIELNKNEYRDDVLLSRSGTLPRSYPRESSSISRGAGTLPRSFPRSCEAVYGAQTSDRGDTFSRIYSKDDTALCNSYSRRGVTYSGSDNLTCNLRTENPVCSGQGGVCSMGVGCCSCCTCYCCCCCWQEDSSRVGVLGYGFRSTQQFRDHTSAIATHRSTPWQGKYMPPRTQHLPRDLTCNTVCTSVDLNSSSASLQHHHQYPQQPHRSHHHQQSRSQEMSSMSYDPRLEMQHPSYQAEGQRHTTPV